jgi:ATP-binding cassette subfamily B protein
MNLDRKLTAFFLSEARKHKREFMIAFILMPFCSILATVGPKILQLTIDEGIAAADEKKLLIYSLIFLVTSCASVALLMTQSLVMQIGGIRTLKEIRHSLVRHISRLGKSAFERTPLGVFVSRATSDVEAVGESVSSGLMSILTDLLSVIFIFSFMIYQDPGVGLRLLIMIPLMVIIIEMFRRRLRGLQERIRTLNGRLAAKLNEAAAMRYEINFFHLAGTLTRSFKDTSEDFRRTSIKSVSLDAGTFSVIEAMNYIAIGTLLILSINLMSDDLLTPGEVVMYIEYIRQLFVPFRQLGQRFNTLQTSYAALNKIDQVVSLPLPIDQGDDTLDAGKIEFDHVSFRYADTLPDVLHDISFTVEPARSLALVGPTGSGKTTIVRLLTRLVEGNRGTIKLGGKELKNLCRESLKKALVLIPQEPAVFKGSVLENITLFREDISRDQVQDICRKIMADDFITMLPQGYDTMLESDGTNISMGQRQLIALARALVSGAEILIFDESTANIDTETERLIQHALEYVMQHKTTVIIAHRLSTIRHANHILVLRNGRIAQAGTHEQLVAEGGLYSRMIKLEEQE